MKLKTCSMALGIALVAGVASAQTVVQSGVMPLSSTNWTESVMIDRFEPIPGRSLVEVSFELIGSVVAWAEIESLDAEPTTIDINLSSLMTIKLNGTDFGTLSPFVTQSFNASPFDGDIDFAGPSGATFGPLTNSVGMSGVAEDLSVFVGTGQLELSIEALGASWATGSGNLLTSFTTDAGFEYRFTYRYSEVPTPGALALCGLAGLAAVGRRRRAGV